MAAPKDRRLKAKAEVRIAAPSTDRYVAVSRSTALVANTEGIKIRMEDSSQPLIVKGEGTFQTSLLVGGI